jgi:hypothetical protein
MCAGELCIEVRKEEREERRTERERKTEKEKSKICTADKWCNIQMYYAHFNFDFNYIYMNK